MIILPAIDLIGGRCVRLRQGDYSQETVFDEDPVAVARRFEAAGAKWLHVVDLDGARAGEPKNLATIRAILGAVKMSVEMGGGIRTTAAVQELLDLGLARVILGTRAVREPEWLAEVAKQFPGRVALGIDAQKMPAQFKGPEVLWRQDAPKQSVMSSSSYVGGWQVQADRTVGDMLRLAAGLPLAAIIYTDIARDGMMTGPNVEATAELAKASRFPVIASGGVTTVDDVRRLTKVGVAGAIIGRSLYEGRITLEAALAAAGDR